LDFIANTDSLLLNFYSKDGTIIVVISLFKVLLEQHMKHCLLHVVMNSSVPKIALKILTN